MAKIGGRAASTEDAPPSFFIALAAGPWELVTHQNVPSLTVGVRLRMTMPISQTEPRL